ncbi:hypothetical protein BB561_006641 [Smittium simulii]|uniref:N-acetylglucosaminylphosphatidylinositol deacetylase n=1 Tax=Smittium simulii TaxID=133385 RepID=A0A2T9Y2Q3_9FUNG|nr:hypothetical protein BB561_006641 [Smittium simulii]
MAIPGTPIYLQRLDLKPKNSKKTFNITFVTAHPDDETMFFAPAILALKDVPNVSISLVCFSTGDSQGLGRIRKTELTKVVSKLGISPSNLIIIDDPAFPDDIKKTWDPVLMAKALEAIIVASETDMLAIFTFDNQGISGHPNHISLYIGIKFMIQTSQTFKFKPVELYTLNSLSLVRKYLFFLDSIFSLGDFYRKSDSVLFVNGLEKYKLSCKTMDVHETQLVWYRKLYVTFSRYMFINSFDRVK